jgi:hypothetical protein
MISFVGLTVVALVLIYVFAFHHIEGQLNKEKRMFGNFFNPPDTLSNLQRYMTKEWRNERASILNKAKQRGADYYNKKWAIYEVRGNPDHPPGEVFCIRTGERLDEFCLDEEI